MCIYDNILLNSTENEKCIENQNTHFMFNNLSPPTIPKNCAVCAIMEEYGSVQQATDDNIMWHMHFAFWITEATSTPSEYATFIAFPRRLWLSKRA